MNQNQEPSNSKPDSNSDNVKNIQNETTPPEQINLDPAVCNPLDLIGYTYIKDITEEKVKEEIDKIIINEVEKEVMNEIENEINKENEYNSEEEDEEDKWIPKFKDCKCCYGFVYKCKGDTCAALGQCYCKMKDDIEQEEAKEPASDNKEKE